ncbi:hypothetical protein D7V91_01910 [bacterium 1xD42-67]|nr:hypothetical protein D7V91_01910 [bacterium 1xD42-67]
MDDLTRCLYEFVCENRMASLSGDKEYIDVVTSAERQEERVASYLNDEQRKELRTLIDALETQSDITCEHLFQAALSLSRELDGLVRG